MNRRQKEVQQIFLDSEGAALRDLRGTYSDALSDINGKIKSYYESIDQLTEAINALDKDDPQRVVLESQRQSKVYQKAYHEQLRAQVSASLDRLKSNQYSTISAYLDDSYKNSFIGSIYDLHGQGVPLMLPINQDKMVQAVTLDSAISEGLYNRLGFDVEKLKTQIAASISRSMANGYSYAQCGQFLSGLSGVTLNKSIRIARTEGHRIQCTAANDAAIAAKEKGADVVKQWDSTLDGLTRESHRIVDGEIRELDESFSNGLKFPGDPSGAAGEVINCRCALLQRCRSALDQDELDTLKERSEFFGLDKTKNFDEFKQKYMQAVEKHEQSV